MRCFPKVIPGLDVFRIDARFFEVCLVVVDHAGIHGKRQGVNGTVVAGTRLHVLLIEAAGHIVGEVAV